VSYSIICVVLPNTLIDSCIVYLPIAYSDCCLNWCEELNNSAQIEAEIDCTEAYQLLNTRSSGTAGKEILENSVQESLEKSIREIFESTRKESLKRKSEVLTVDRRAWYPSVGPVAEGERSNGKTVEFRP